MISTNRWFAHKSNYLQYFHTFIGLAISVITIFSVVALFRTTGFEIENPHTVLGFIIFISCIFLSINGMVTYKMKKDLKWNSPFILRLRKYHRRGSWVILVLGVITIGFGIHEFVDESATLKKYSFLNPLEIVGMLAIYLLAEILFRYIRR
jgi:uncharacterized membrane protein YidH (DUF202 family)